MEGFGEQHDGVGVMGEQPASLNFTDAVQ